jgi:hypothetical protein
MNEDDDIEVVYENIVEFTIDNQDFVIEYSKEQNEFTAIHFDEDEFDFDIIIPNDLSEDMELFDGYILTVDYFKKLVELVK